MPLATNAVELTKGDDHLNIWVDANNNGVRDDDDVNIFITKAGGFYTESVTFKGVLDEHLKQRLKEASMALLEHFPGSDQAQEEQICSLALELIVRATNAAAAESHEMTPDPVGADASQSAMPTWQPMVAELPEEALDTNEHGIPRYHPPGA